MFARRLVQGRELLKRWVSGATRHPGHLKKRFGVRSEEIWEEVGPVLEGYRYVEEEKEVLTKYRLGRTAMGCFTMLHQKERDDALSEDETPEMIAKRPYRQRERMTYVMKVVLHKKVRQLLYAVQKEKYSQHHRRRWRCHERADMAFRAVQDAYMHYCKWMEFPQYCDLLGRMGRVAYNFEDKGWICDACSTLIQKLATGIPRELELLDRVQLMHAYYGLSSLGPQILKMEIKQRKRTLSVQELLQTFVERAFEILDDLDGTDRCHLMEGRVLVGKRLAPKQIEMLLNDAYPLLKSREGIHQMHPTSLASLLWAMGKHGCENKWKIVPTCLKELCQPKRFNRLRAADMARAIWGLGQLGVRSGHEEFMEKIQRYIQFGVDVTEREMYNCEAVEFAEGLVLVGYEQVGREVVDYLVRDVAKRLTPLTAKEQERFLRACEAIGYPNTTSKQPLMSKT